MKIFLFVLIAACIAPFGISAQTISGTISTATGKQPLIGASVHLKQNKHSTATNRYGQFTFHTVSLPDTLVVSYAGYKTQQVIVADSKVSIVISMEETQTTLQEVNVNTGYYQIAKDRSTGSFTQVSGELLNRSVGPRILDRLEGIASGMQFDRRLITGENQGNQRPELRIRGLSTIAGGSSPLIIVDNFPYEGDINSINPNDVESITLLKDAAAASIWGARAGNGVIVINTRQGQFNRPVHISFNSNLNLTAKPDLFYSKNYLPSATAMEIQESLFQLNAYPEDDLTYIPPYVELLIKQRENEISQEDFTATKALMEQTDFRTEALKHLYQTGRSQQYAFNVSGGSNTYKHYLGAGYDKSSDNVIGNGSSRINLNFQNTYKVTPKLELNGNIWYTLQQTENNGVTFSNIGSGIREPYTLLTDAEGNSMTSGYYGRRLAFLEQAESKGLLDWQYRPLDERELTDQTSNSNEVRLNGGLRYRFFQAFSLNATYQYLRGASEKRAYYDVESYYTRNLINRFTQADGSLVIPNGGILDGPAPNKFQGHSGRVQLNYDQTFGDHALTLLAGTEVSQRTAQQTPGFRTYNYSKDLLGGTTMFDYTKYYPVRPLGSARIENAAAVSLQTNDRALSYFSNGSYRLREKYTISGSARWDGSNLLGVKTNQRGTALWSAGTSWEISKEDFYPIGNLLPYVRLRLTYGSGGLIDKSQSQYATIGYAIDSRTGFYYSSLQHPGNPSLRWEQVNTLNAGLDWSSQHQRLSGSIDWYNKEANHLLGSFMIDPTTGAGDNYKQNYADMRTSGLDIQLNSINIAAPFRWESNLLLNYTRNKITNYTTPESTTIWDYFSSTRKPPAIGKSVDAFYAFPWNGLNPADGSPLIFIDGVSSSDYSSYAANFKPENLVESGVEVPPFFGSFRNTFQYKGFELSAMLTFKTGYVFRRTSMEPGAEYLFGNADYHTDYYLRWKQPGDETKTYVPSGISDYPEVANIYGMSEVLITSGNHIRLQDINLAYSLPGKAFFGSGNRQVRIYAYTRNLGVIWKENKFGIDPEYANAEFPAARTIAFGIQLIL